MAIKLSNKDKLMIVNHYVGEQIFQHFPGIEKLLQNLTEDKDLAKVITGTIAVGFTKTVVKKITAKKPLSIDDIMHDIEDIRQNLSSPHGSEGVDFEEVENRPIDKE